VSQDLLSFAAQQQPGHPAPAVRSHEDQVAANLSGTINDGLIGDVARNRQGIDHDPGVPAKVNDEIQRLLCLLLGHFGELLGRRRVDQCALAIVGNRVLRFGVERRDAGTGLLGKRNCPASGFL